ncbi:MAG: hypothetical protein ACF8XB_22840 [Planctomycetota bacterium JB042]
MRSTRSPALAALALFAALGGCAHISGGVSPASRPLAPGSYEVLGPVRGQDCVYYILGLIPVMNGNETHVALKDALRKEPGADALIEVTSDTYWQHWIVVSRVCTQVQGTAVRVR